MVKTRPFLKWAGGKYSSLPVLLKHLPQCKRLVEPFVGSGAVFLNTDYKNYLLADINLDLINLYLILKEQGDAFIQDGKKYFTPQMNCAEKYYEQRELFNTTQDTYLKAHLFIYLNRHCFNGLCRYNSKSKFNVPFGRYKSPIYPEDGLHIFYKKSQQATFKAMSFLDLFKEIKIGDVVYCDPPYVNVSLSETASFTAYSTSGFDASLQKQLADHALRWVKKGIPILISNHDTPFTRKIYQGAEIYSFEVHRVISCKGGNRVPAKELLAVFV